MKVTVYVLDAVTMMIVSLRLLFKRPSYRGVLSNETDLAFQLAILK